MIKKSEETNFYRELCMSSSILWSDIERPCTITITWTDENGETQTKEYTSFMARLIQHEYDHLQGCVCLDKSIPGTISFVDSNPAKEEIRNKPFNLD
jgi:peptide deformylase